MAPDQKKIYIISLLGIAVLLLALFAPMGMGRPLAAVLLLPVAAAACLFIRKRRALSLHAKMVLLLMAVIGALYLMGYYVSGLFVGFTKTGYGLKPDVIMTLILPIGMIIVTTELIRYVLCAQEKTGAAVFAYLICLVADVLICSNLAGISNFATFMDVVGMTLFPGLLYNLLYNYLSARYGWKPNLAFRALTVWIFYWIPYGSAISQSLLAFVNLLLPIAIYLFIDALYEKKRRYALGKKNRVSRIVSRALTALVLILMIGTVMLVSNHFTYGAYVIATESMTGELNKGDVAICERYEAQFIQEGQIVAFERSDSVVVHRIVDIKIVNGITQYYTQGDANENRDAGYITDGQILGLVKAKVPLLGYPSLWLRSLFAH